MKNPKLNQERFLAGLEFKSHPGDLLSLLSLRSGQLWFSLRLTLPFAATSVSPPPLLLVLCFSCPMPSTHPALLSSSRFLQGRKHEWVGSCPVKTSPTRQDSWNWDLIGAMATYGHIWEHRIPMARIPVLPSVHVAVCARETPWGWVKSSKCGKHLGFHRALWSLHECWQTSITELSRISRTLQISYIQIWTPEIPTYHHPPTPSMPALPTDFFISVEEKSIFLFTQPMKLDSSLIAPFRSHPTSDLTGKSHGHHF